MCQSLVTVELERMGDKKIGFAVQTPVCLRFGAALTGPIHIEGRPSNRGLLGVSFYFTMKLSEIARKINEQRKWHEIETKCQS